MLDDTREAWGATAPTYSLKRVTPRSRVGITWHWAGPAVRLFGKDHSACLAQAKEWQRQHKAKGWGDIGYNVLICVHARAIEARGVDLQGAHSPGHNTSHYGVQFMVGEGEEVTEEMFARAVRLSTALEEHSGHDLDDEGHSDNTATGCPGPQVYEWVHSGGPDEEEFDMDEATLRRIIREEVKAVTDIDLTNTQRDNIYGNHATSPARWTLPKALGYVSGQAALIRNSVRTETDEIDEALDEMS